MTEIIPITQTITRISSSNQMTLSGGDNITLSKNGVVLKTLNIPLNKTAELLITLRGIII